MLQFGVEDSVWNDIDSYFSWEFEERMTQDKGKK